MAKKSGPRFVADAAFIEEQTKLLVSDLAFYASRPVSIQLQNGKEIAYTTNTSDKMRTIRIVMNPTILKKVRNRDRAMLIWRGIGFHELAHHLYESEAQHAQAIKEGFGQLFNLMDDEQNERRGAAHDHRWGAAFQSTVAFIFPTKKIDATKAHAGHSHKDDGKTCHGMEAMELYIRRFNEFAYHLRRHVTGPEDAQVAAALDLIPRRFKDMSKDDLLVLVRQVHEALMKGIELPKPAQIDPKAQKPDEKPPEPEDEPEEEEKEEEEPQAPEEAPVGWRQLLKSKWAIAGLVTFVAAWVYILLQGGADLWWNALIFTLIFVTVFMVIGIARSGMGKRLRAVVHMPKPPPEAIAKLPSAASARRLIMFLLIASALGFGGYYAWIYFGDSLPRWLLAILAAPVIMGLMLLIIWFVPGGKEAVSGYLPERWRPNNYRKDGYRHKKDSIWKVIVAKPIALLFKGLWFAISFIFKTLRGWLTALWKWFASWRLWPLLWRAASWTGIKIRKAFYWTVRTVVRLSRKTLVRILILALPIAIPVAMLFAVGMKAVELNWWVLLAIIIWLLLLLLLFWLFRKKLTQFMLSGMAMDGEFLHNLRYIPEIDREHLEFNVIGNIVPIEADDKFLKDTLPETLPLGQQLRPHVERCGSVWSDKEEAYDGFDLIDEVEQAALGRIDVFVDEEKRSKASIHIEVGIDCSSSMLSATESLRAGEKFNLARRFALIVEEAVRNQVGVSAHFWGFTDTAIYDCGEPGQYRASGLAAAGGNNDSAMLWHMGQSAARSGKEIRILLMISDGQPSECTWGSLFNLVGLFESEGMVPVQIAVDRISEPAFKTWFVDLVGQTMEEAVVTFGQMLVALMDRS